MSSFELQRLSSLRSGSSDHLRLSSEHLPSVYQHQISTEPESGTPGDQIPSHQGHKHASHTTMFSASSDSPELRGTNKKDATFLHYRLKTLWLFFVYLPFLIVPWVLTCIMAQRPPSLPSYYNQKGEYGSHLYEVILRWMTFIRVLNSISSVLTVPVISALLAQAAVVYCQRRKLKQSLTLRQTLALSDRAWGDIELLWRAGRGNGTGSVFMWLAAFLLLLGSIQAPIQQVLVSIETITIMTCQDQPDYIFSVDCDTDRLPLVAAYDPEPYVLAQIPKSAVLQNVVQKLAVVSDNDVQLHMWHESSENHLSNYVQSIAGTNSFSWYYTPSIGEDGPAETYYVSALLNNTDTGILREHAMRLNSTAECSLIDAADFPTLCSGDQPFVASYHQSGNLSIDICVPGNVSASPWTISRDRQDLREDMFINVIVPNESVLFTLGPYGGNLTNFTVHCNANTTRGYFELGNIQNNFVAGHLIDRWPDDETLWNDYNDYLWDEGGQFVVPNNTNSYSIWQYQDDYNVRPFLTYDAVTPGPLATSAIAMFGNYSFFYVAANSTKQLNPYALSTICQSDMIPFINLGSSTYWFNQPIQDACDRIEDDYDPQNPENNFKLNSLIYNWFQVFSRTGLDDPSGDPWVGDSAKEILEVAMFLSTESWLMSAVASDGNGIGGRAVYTSPGSPVFRPSKTAAATVVISVLMFLEVLGLLIVAWYIYTVPTWTTKLDSFAVAQLLKGVSDDAIPPIGHVGKEDLEKLKDVDGLVGIAGDEPIDTTPASRPILARGGTGLITWKHAQSSKKAFRWRRRKEVKESLLGDGAI